ncbi:MAG: ABC transporter ATP-binding protein [Parcubacteria group bacterium]|nr:ABC transporter ATP-binding protein [Parcubacteria group bacterium]
MKKLFKSFLHNISLLKRGFGPYKKQIAVLTLVGFLSGLLEGVGANALIPLFSFITGDGAGGEDFVSRSIERVFGFVGVDFTLTYLLFFIAALFILKAMVLFIGSYIQYKIAYGYEKRVRTELFEKSLRSTWGYLLNQKIGHLEKILSVEVRYVMRLLETVSSLVLILTSLLVFLAIAFNISIQTTSIALATGIVVMIVFQPLINKIRKITREVASRGRDIAHFVNENVLGMKTIKAMSVTSPVSLVGESNFEALRLLQIRRSLLSNAFGSFFQPFGVVFVLVLFAVSYKTSTFSLPAFIAIVYLIQRIFTQVHGFQTHTQTIFGMLPYLENVLSYQEHVVQNQEQDEGSKPFRFEKTFSFNNISFGYKADKNVLSNISFQIAKGSFIGLIGPSGAGKTTIVDLVLRLFKPNSGDILVDGISISEIDLHEFRKKVGYVSQDLHLINDTVANNIRFFDDAITDAKIQEAAKQANIQDTITSLPNGFDSIVGERGVQFSAGQRQRIVIARVLARNPRFLILDEATSALDNESEKKIQEVIENLKGKITVLVIAHRLGTVMNCDELLVLDRGEIIEKGKPKDLLANEQAYFYKMYNIRE